MSTPNPKRVAFEASKQSNDTMEVDEEEAEGSPQPRQAGRRAHTAGAAASKTQRKVSTAAHAAGKADTPAPVKGKQKDADPVTNAVATSVKRVPAKRAKNKGKEKAIEGSPQSGSGPQSGQKQTRSDLSPTFLLHSEANNYESVRSTNSDDDTALPDNIAAAFMANSESPSPSKKVKSTKSAGSSKTLTVLQTENLKTVK
ncbi:hypothetical protein B0H11DRAFT_2247467 [Mycena galericulata]|nr:hypothetical protein B0H11DRAFT_2247467 [Mycena galericulata]